MQRAGSRNGVAIRPLHDPNLLRAQAYGNDRTMVGRDLSTNGNESHSQKKTPAQGGRLEQCGGFQRPSSNTTSMFADSVLSPGATEVSLAKPASAAIARIIGIGRGTLAPPSLMLTIRRTFRPNASA